MDGVDLIICLAIWTLYKRRLPLTSDDFLAICIASRNRLRSTSLCNAFYLDFGGVWGGFWRPKRRPKSIFERFFFDVFRDGVLASILVGFLEAWTLKNHQKPLFFLWFLLIFAKSSFSQNIKKKLDFGSIFGGQNEEKSIKHGVQKYVFFWR